MRSRVQVVGWTLVWSGVLVLGYLGFQLFATDWITARAQTEASVALAADFVAARGQLPAPESAESPAPEVVRESVPEMVREVAQPVTGEAFAKLSIPLIELEAVVFEGVDRETLKRGPGHMPATAFPGQPGNAVLSGHRTTYGKPFFDLDQLRPGDRIQVETAIGLHVYEVRESLVVLPTDVWVAGDRPGAWLTLTTCNPKFSARERLIIFAELVDGPNLDYVRYLEERFEDLS